jgi:preprotein translocase subunit SecA
MGDVAGYYPTRFTAEELSQAQTAADIAESLIAEATGYYEQREQQLGEETMREIERRVMLSIIDQRWREHLYEMDYLQEGIHLRAMGQKDPLVEWQREGYDMFTQMTDAIGDDFVRYVMHLEVVAESAPAPVVHNVQYSAPEDPVQGTGAVRQAAAAQRVMEEVADIDADAPVVHDVQVPVVKSEMEKTPRNAPCPCGSGKKFKLCHGR